MTRIRKVRGQNIDIGLDSIDVIAIQVRTPVRTGNLRDNFNLDQGRAVNSTYYGDWVERGTSRFHGRFMTARAIPEIAERLVKKVGRQLDEVKLLDLPKRR